MLRVLKFEGDGAQEKFDKVWEGFLFGTRSDQGRKQGAPPNVEVQRRRAKLTRKLKEMSQEGNRKIAGDIKYRELKTPELALEQQELELLVKTMEEADWVPEQLDLAFDVIDWVSAADKVE